MAGRNPITRIIITAKDEASAVFGSLQAKAGAVAAAIGAYFTGRLFSDAIGSARDFEAAMSAVQAAAGASAEELAALRNAAEEAGASTKYTSVEAANALENLAKSGLSAAQAVQSLPAVLDLAQAGGVGLAEAADYVTKAVNGMGLAFSEAGTVADVLSMGANASNTSVQGLGLALSYAAPLANSLGLSLTQTVAIIGKFADAGIDAGRAGTALNSILAQFSNPASKFRQELAAAGITTGDFDQALRQLAAAGPNGQRAINAVGQEAGPALRALLNQGIGSLDELKAKLDESAGSAATFAKVMGDNLDGAAKGFGSAWDALLIKLGTPVLDTLKTQINAVSDRLRGFVADGTATAFGNAIKAAFESAGRWAAEFIAKVDFTRVAAALQSFAARAGEVLTSIGRHATTAGNAMQAAYGVMAAGTNTVLAGVYKLGQGVSWLASAFLSDVALMTEGLSRITFGDLSRGFASAAASMRAEAQATYAVYQEFGRQADDAFDAATEGALSAREGWAGLTGAAHEGANAAAGLAAAYGTAAASAQESATAQVSEIAKIQAKIAELKGEQQRLTAEGDIKGATRVWREITRLSQEARDAATSAATGMAESARASSAAQQEAAQATQAEVAKLREEYARLIAAGDTQGAAEKLVDLQRRLKETGARASATAAEVELAFQNLGVTSQSELDRLANSARRSFQLIRESGTATPRELQRAFMSYAQQAIAANGGVATAALKTEAAVYKVRIEADATGQAIVSAAQAGAAGLAQLGQQADEVAAKIAVIERRASGLKDVWDADGNLIDEPDERTHGGGRNGGGFTSYTKRGAYERAKSEGLDDATALRLAEEFGDTNRLSEFQAAIDAAVLAAARRAASTARASSGQHGTALSQPAVRDNSGPVVHRVDVRLGERARSINTDAAGAAAISELFRQLESDMSRS